MPKKLEEKKAIYEYSKYLLNVIWACGHETEYMDVIWKRKDFRMSIQVFIAFQKGCCMADGRKWYKRLNKQWEEYVNEHGAFALYN